MKNGFMPCQTKALPDRGISISRLRARHKSHVTKVMVVCIVGFAFEGSIANGGEAIKVGIWRCQRIDAAQRIVYADRGC